MKNGACRTYKLWVYFLGMTLASCGVVEEESSCTKFYVYNDSASTLEVSFEGWLDSAISYEGIIAAGERVRIGGACSFGSHSYPSEVFTEFSIHKVDNQEKVLVYSAVENNDWVFDEVLVDGYNNQELTLTDSDL